MTARPGLVIFDCDGVLVDSEGPANRRLAEWLTAAGHPADEAMCRRRFSGRSMTSVREELLAAGTDLGEDFVERWNAGLPDLFADGLQAIPHVREAVAELRAAGLAWCVASSARVTKMQLTLGLTGLLPLFEDVLFSASMVARGKPFPDLFLFAAGRMGFPPSACIVVEDSVPGTAAGIAAGMRVLSYAADPHADRAALIAAGGMPFEDMRHLPGLVLGRVAPAAPGSGGTRRGAMSSE